ncbi:MAG: putative cyclic nucleotide-binding transcriptional regulator [Symbiobacteriaceae bacterium]|jgi:CRP/FNR family transcriptional regulator|nr:putative cyclic nucleotide-binding transcriptional regulator [Symbiobacteriaceae bacterium]
MAFLSSLPLFEGLSGEELAQVAAIARERRYRKGTILFDEGDPGETMYFIKDGKVRVTRLAAGGQEQVLRVWGPGSAIGLVVLADKAPYPASAQVAEDAVLYALRVDDLVGLMPDSRALAANAFRLVGQRLRAARDTAHDLAVHTTHGRLASLLLKTSEEKGSTRFNLGLTHQDIAGMIGTSRETVTRVLADFRRTGCIKVEGEEIVIANEKKLREWMGEQ